MDLCAEKLLENFPPGKIVEASIPRFRRVLGWLPFKKTLDFDRWYNRWRVYPSHVKKLATRPGFFHIVDHSYAHLANFLPEGKVGVYCHDLDAFKCVLVPEQDPRPEWFRRMMISVFEGLKKARFIFCSTNITRESLLQLGYWRSENIKIVPYGVADEFQPSGPKKPGEYILHVGSCIPRKRIDILIDIFAKIRSSLPEISLIQAGGTFTGNQVVQINRLGLSDSVKQIRGLGRDGLAALYRGAKCLLVTSEAEGFGLPVIEALSCGCPVVASDIPTLREAGSDFATFCKIGDLDLWVQSVLKVIDNIDQVNRIKVKSFLDRYSWKKHSEVISETYSNFMALL